MNAKTISLDAMGGDFGPTVVVPSALRVLRDHPDVRIIFVGDETVLKTMLEAKGNDLADRWEIKHATQVVTMDESPASALRSKKDSSMRVAINLVKEGAAQACVSAGNTGALMATARFVLKTLPGIDRPAIMTQFPTRKGKEVRMLDLGANVDCTAEHLYQFAVMGSIVAHAVDGIDSPSVGLLNIGEEEIKGNEQVKKTAELLSKSKIVNYIGYVEGDAIFSGNADVIVCDGFVGNVTLKACEGIAKLIAYFVRQSFQANWKTKLVGKLTKPVLKKLISRIDPRRRNGATLVGLDGIVVKSHGGAGVMAFANAVEEAIIEIEKNVPGEIKRKINEALAENQSL